MLPKVIDNYRKLKVTWQFSLRVNQLIYLNWPNCLQQLSTVQIVNCAKRKGSAAKPMLLFIKVVEASKRQNQKLEFP